MFTTSLTSKCIQSLPPMISPLLGKFCFGHSLLFFTELTYFQACGLESQIQGLWECHLADFVICRSTLTLVHWVDANAIYFSFRVLEYLPLANWESTDTWHSLLRATFQVDLFTFSVKFKCHFTIHVYVEDSNRHFFGFFKKPSSNFSHVRGLFQLLEIIYAIR